MGQQQLILLVLCTIVIGIAIAVGIVMFTSSSLSASRDAMLEDMNTIIANSREYYLRTKSLGGGGNSFDGYYIPARLRGTLNGDYSAAPGSGTGTLVITGKSVDNELNTIEFDIDGRSKIPAPKFGGEFADEPSASE